MNREERERLKGQLPHHEKPGLDICLNFRDIVPDRYYFVFRTQRPLQLLSAFAYLEGDMRASDAYRANDGDYYEIRVTSSDRQALTELAARYPYEP